MKILLYETDSASAIGLPILIKDNLNIDTRVDTTNDINEILSSVRLGFYDLLLINLDNELDINIGTEIREISSDIKILLLSSNLEQDIIKILAGGFNGVWIKGKDIDTLIEAISLIRDKQDAFYLDPRITSRVRNNVRRLEQLSYFDKSRSFHCLESVTERELQVLGLVIGGNTDAFICNKLEIAPTTLKTHMKSLRNKFSVRSKADLITKSWLTGISFGFQNINFNPVFLA